MTTFYKLAAQLARLVHARLSPFSFLINLSLLSLLARMILSLASSPHVHTILASTSTSLQGLDVAAFKSAIASVELSLCRIFLLTIFIILVLLLLAKGRSGSTGTSLYQAIVSFLLEDEPADSVDDHDLVCYKPAIPSAPSIAPILSPAPTIERPVSSAPPFELATTCVASTPAEDQQLQAILMGVAAPPSKLNPITSCAPLHVDITTLSNHLEEVPLSPELTHRSQYLSINTEPRESTPASFLGPEHTQSKGYSESHSIATHRLSENQDITKLCKLPHGKPSLIIPSSPTLLSPPIPSSPTHPGRPMEVVPTSCWERPVSKPRASQKGLFRNKSDAKTASSSSSHAANDKGLIRYKSDIQKGDCFANVHAYYGRVVGSTIYYEYTRDEACSTTRVYTSSSLDKLSKEDANKHFSEFTSRKWAGVRNNSEAGCNRASPPPSPLHTRLAASCPPSPLRNYKASPPPSPLHIKASFPPPSPLRICR